MLVSPPPDDVPLGISESDALNLAVKSLITQFDILDLRVAVNSDPTWVAYWSAARDRTQKAIFALQRLKRKLDPPP